MWTFEDNIAHNNPHSGIYFWQNGAPRTIVNRFTAYHCGQGIFAGSYANLVSYRDCTIYAVRERRAGRSPPCPARRASAPTRRSPTRGCTSTRPGCTIRRRDHQAPRPRRAGHRGVGVDVPGRHAGPGRASPRAATTRSCTTSSTARSTATSSGWPTTCRPRPSCASTAATATRSSCAAPTNRAIPRPEWNASVTTPDRPPSPARRVRRRGGDRRSSLTVGEGRRRGGADVRGRGARAGAAHPADVDERLGLPRRQTEELDDRGRTRPPGRRRSPRCGPPATLGWVVHEPAARAGRRSGRGRRRSSAAVRPASWSGSSARRARSPAQRSCSASTAAAKSSGSWPRATMCW